MGQGGGESRELRQDGEVTAAGRAKGREERQGEKEEERMGDGGSGVWDRLSLEGNQSPQGSRHTYMHTNAQRELTPLNLISLFSIFPTPQMPHLFAENTQFWRRRL